MRKLLLATAAVLALTASAKADIITNLGLNPTSGAGAFSNTDPGSVLLPAVTPQNGGSGVASLGGLFLDTYNFTLDQALTLTIAFSVNTFAGGAPQFITGFTGAVLDAGNVVVLGPEAAVPCFAIPNCQVFGGSANLNAGSYHLAISGNAGVDAGYGGNISTFAVPGPIAGAGIPGLIAAFGGLFGLQRARRRRNSLAV